MYEKKSENERSSEFLTNLHINNSTTKNKKTLNKQQFFHKNFASVHANNCKIKRILLLLLLLLP